MLEKKGDDLHNGFKTNFQLFEREQPSPIYRGAWKIILDFSNIRNFGLITI